MMWQRYKGLIAPNMGATFKDALRIAAAKSEHLVHYLRARRAKDYRMVAFHRKQHMSTAQKGGE